ncbi:MAG: hypothetical protein Q7T85_04515 [Nitrosomonas sp.]|nr:hypothetical protein [Nitrosomonas sp.]
MSLSVFREDCCHDLTASCLLPGINLDDSFGNFGGIGVPVSEE